jgi:VCBS repeat-containing protein
MARQTDPEITGKWLKYLREDANQNVATGDLDVSNGPDLFRPVEGIEGKYGTFSINEIGVWTYLLDNSRAATQGLAQGETGDDRFYAQTLDGTLSQQVIVVVRGADDPDPIPTLGLMGVSDFIA